MICRSLLDKYLHLKIKTFKIISPKYNPLQGLVDYPQHGDAASQVKPETVSKGYNKPYAYYIMTIKYKCRGKPATNYCIRYIHCLYSNMTSGWLSWRWWLQCVGFIAWFLPVFPFCAKLREFNLVLKTNQKEKFVTDQNVDPTLFKVWNRMQHGIILTFSER